jgi:hypothetical protein
MQIPVGMTVLQPVTLVGDLGVYFDDKRRANTSLASSRPASMIFDVYALFDHYWAMTSLLNRFILSHPDKAMQS